MKKHLFKRLRENSVIIENLQYLNQENSLLPPSSSARWRLHSSVSKNTGLPILSAPNQRALFLGRARHQHFSTCPLFPFTVAKFQLSMVERWGSFLPPSLPLWNILPYSWHRENIGSLSTLSWLIKQQFPSRRGKPERPQAFLHLSPGHLILKRGCHSKKSTPLYPTAESQP